MSEDAEGTVFMVQTTIPYGDPAKGMLLRLIVQATVDASVGEMALIVENERVLIGDHILVDRERSTAETSVVFRREPIAIPASKVGYIKPFTGRLGSASHGVESGLTAHQVKRGLA